MMSDSSIKARRQINLLTKMSKEGRLAYGKNLEIKSHRENMKLECENMDALAIMISGNSDYPDMCVSDEDTFFSIFTGQNSKQDDHFVQEAFNRGIPIHVFYRRLKSDCFVYYGESTHHEITDDSPDNLMEGYLFCPNGGIVCGKAVVPGPSERYVKKNGALSIIPGMEVIDESKVPRCFVPLKKKV